MGDNVAVFMKHLQSVCNFDKQIEGELIIFESAGPHEIPPVDSIHPFTDPIPETIA